MPNTTVRAAAEGMPANPLTRRTVLSQIGAVAALVSVQEHARASELSAAREALPGKDPHMNMVANRKQFLSVEITPVMKVFHEWLEANRQMNVPLAEGGMTDKEANVFGEEVLIPLEARLAAEPARNITDFAAKTYVLSEYQNGAFAQEINMLIGDLASSQSDRPHKFTPALTGNEAEDLSFMARRKPHGTGIEYWRVNSGGGYGEDCATGKALGEEYLSYIGQHPTNGNATLLGCIVNDMLARREVVEKGRVTGIEIGFLATINRYAMATAVFVEQERQGLKSA